MPTLTPYEQRLLAGWEDVHKKSQLTLWILLSLKDGPKHMADMKAFIYAMTNQLITADDKSMYRALRRYYDADMVTFHEVPSENGPDRKIYELTKTGQAVLDHFIERTISSIFDKPVVRKLLSS